MRNLGFALLAVSIVLGAVAVLGLRHISGARATTPAHGALATVVVATRPIGFGEAIGPEVLRVQAWPAGAQPTGSFSTVSEITSGQKRVALGPITANEPILASRITGPGGRATLSGVLRPGMRAAAIRVNDVVGVAGFVLPGDFVDVLLTRNDGANNKDTTMRTDVLISSVRVLAADQLANESKNDPVVAKAVTVEVTPQQAQQLALATQVGTLSLALRGTVDPFAKPDAAPTVRVSDLRLQGVAPVAKPAVVRRKARPVGRGLQRASIELFRGVQSVQVTPAADHAG